MRQIYSRVREAVQPGGVERFCYWPLNQRGKALEFSFIGSYEENRAAQAARKRR